MANQGVKGDAVAITEKPDTLRRKVEFLRQRSVGGIWQTVDVTAAYTLLQSDWGSLIKYTSASDAVFTVPVDLPEGWWCGVVQLGAGRASFTPDTGATVNSRVATDRTLDQYSRAWVEVVSNSEIGRAHV